MQDGCRPPKHNAVDMTGKTYGYLTALYRDHTKGKAVWWRFRCICGTEKALSGNEVRRGKTKSCGCMRGKLMVQSKGTHGMSEHPAYWVWRSMHDRCKLPSHQAWKNYGARGIKVCKRWATFERFWQDMGSTYQPGLTLDRRKNDRGYAPGNCRWVTSRVQANNTRCNRIVHTPRGEMTVSQASRMFGVKVNTILYRLAAGWPDEKAVTITPDYRNALSTIS